MSADESRAIADGYQRKGLVYPRADDLDHPDGNRFDDLIAVWVDYFNGKFPVKPPYAPLDPDAVKTLIASESGFRVDPPGNPVAIGIAQITRPTLKALQDPAGEAKEVVFRGIRQKDLKNPEIAIPLAVRWLMRKRDTAAVKLRRPPTTEELMKEYKGLQKSKTQESQAALDNFRRNYARLKKK